MKTRRSASRRQTKRVIRKPIHHKTVVIRERDPLREPTPERPYVLRDEHKNFLHAVADFIVANELARALGFRVKVWKWRGDDKKEVLLSYNGFGWKRNYDEEEPSTPEVVALIQKSKKHPQPWKRPN